MSADESSPLLHTTTSVSQRHRLAPPSIRFPGHTESSNRGLERQQSYGFSSAGNLADSSTSDATLVNDGDRRNGSKQPYNSRLRPTREDSKTYTSFPVPTGTPWREPGTPMDQREYPFFTRLFGLKPSNDSQDQNQIYDVESQSPERQPGLPKVSRECLIAEIKCYGKYILPTLLVFVVLVLVIALGLFNHYKD